MGRKGIGTPSHPAAVILSLHQLRRLCTQLLSVSVLLAEDGEDPREERGYPMEEGYPRVEEGRKHGCKAREEEGGGRRMERASRTSDEKERLRKEQE